MDAINAMALALAHLHEAYNLLHGSREVAGAAAVAPIVAAGRSSLHKYLMTAIDAEASQLERSVVRIRPEGIPF